MEPRAAVEASADKLFRLAEVAKARPEEVSEAWMKLQGESPGHPDPYWLVSSERKQFISGVASDLGLNPGDLLILHEVISSLVFEDK